MAESVRSALSSVTARHFGLDDDDNDGSGSSGGDGSSSRSIEVAGRILEALRQQGRYVEEIFT